MDGITSDLSPVTVNRPVLQLPLVLQRLSAPPPVHV
jgi:hypothetical protein